MNKSKRIIALAMAILVLVGLTATGWGIGRTNSESGVAANKYLLLCGKITDIESTHHSTLVNESGNVLPNSTLSFCGPLKGAVKRGKPYYGNRHNNIDNLQKAISVLAKISGRKKADYSSSSKLMNLANKILKYCVSNQYYIRTLYYSKDGDMYYYKYDYYTNGSYTQYIGTDYSPCYSVLY